MNTPPITVVGTPQGFWTRWVRQTLSRLEHAQVHADLPSPEALGAALIERPEAKALVLVEHPATGLARLLSEGSAVDPRAWLDEWHASGRALLAHAQRHPTECLLVNADDARCRPGALAALLHSRWGESFMPPADDAPTCALDPLASALAWSFVDRNPAVQDVADELLASCAVLPGDEGRVTALVSRGISDGAAATGRLAGLIEAERRLTREQHEFERERGELREARQLEAQRFEVSVRTLESDRAALAARAARVEQELADACRRVEAAERERATLIERLDDAAARHADISREVADARARSDSLALRLESKQDALDAMRRDLEASNEGLDTATAHADALTRELQQVRARLGESVSQRHEIEADLEAMRVECDAQRRRVAEALQSLEVERQRATASEQESRGAREEGELLLQQLHQVQEELERTYLARRDAENALLLAKAGSDAGRLEEQLQAALEDNELLTLQMNQVREELERVHQQKLILERDAKARIPLPGMNDVSIGEVIVCGDRDTLPHREVSFVLRDVRAGSRQVAEASVRLVEHWGRPGLAVFAGNAGTSLFGTWSESGREDGRPYMLLVHGEDAAQRLFDAMGAFDWHLLQAVAARLEQVLQASGPELRAAWSSLAMRLRTSLQEQPARLRYEGIRVISLGQESPDVACWGLMLEHACYRGRAWRRLTIQWRPNGPRPSIDLVRDEETGPPLLVWPADADGAPIRILQLPIGDDPHAPHVRSAWDALTGADRAFVAELLGLLPIFAVHVQASSVDVAPAAASGVDLQGAARNALLFGRTALQTQPATAVPAGSGRRLMQRLARRLRGSVQPESVPAVATESTR